jgi:hypothetical protein
MATDHADAASDIEPTEDRDRPRFRGCIFCYAAEWAVHAVRSAR